MIKWEYKNTSIPHIFSSLNSDEDNGVSRQGDGNEADGNGSSICEKDLFFLC